MAEKNYESHWSGSSYLLKFFIFPPTFLIPIPILFFFHPPWFMVLSVAWMGLTFWLFTKGLGIGGMKLLLRRWLQGKHLRPRKRLRK